MAKILREYVDFQDLEILKEETEDKKKSYNIKGPYIQAEIKNKNNRRYSLSIVEREVKKLNDEKISKNRCWGEADHPEVPVVSLQKVSHMIKELKMDGKNAIGCSQTLDTPCGRVLNTLLDVGGQLMVSTRGVGTLSESKQEKGIKEVNNDWKLITVDCVSDGSAPGCVVEGILESKDYIIGEDGEIYEAFENLKSKVDKKYNSDLITIYLKEFFKELRNKYTTK